MRLCKNKKKLLTLHLSKKTYLCGMSKKHTIATTIICVCLLALSLMACTDSSMMERRLEEIEAAGDTCPTAALASYDSLKGDMAASTEHTRNRYALLGVRLRDKADMKPKSDSCIIRLVDYFEKKGTNRERQEAYYYAGSVYRDLQDTPRAMEYFRKSSDCTESGEVDSLLLRNCHSQLYGCYTQVQDYAHALKEANEEYSISEKLNMSDIVSQVHVANAYMRTDDMKNASQYMKYALKEVARNTTNSSIKAALYDMLYFFAADNDITHMKQCHEMLKSIGCLQPYTPRESIAIGQYFEVMGATDSCAHYYQQAFEMGELLCKYDAAKKLFYLYDSIGNREMAYKYASEYLRVSEELDLGSRQEQAATANNQYQYYKDKEKEEKAQAEKTKMKMQTWLIVLSIVSILCLAYILYIRKKYQRMKSLQSIAVAFGDEIEEQANCSTEKEMLTTIRRKIEEIMHDQQNLKEEMARVIKETEEKSQKAQKQLDFGASLIRMAHSAEESSQEALTNQLKEAARLHRPISQKDWRQIYTIMADKSPDLLRTLSDSAGKHREEWLQACCLLALDLTCTEIQPLIPSVSRATIFRWHADYKEILANDKATPKQNRRSQKEK